MEPLSYYSRESGLGLAMKLCKDRSARRVGIIGLGTGTIAAYGQPGDTYRFYEINPLVPQIANTQFRFLRDSKARIEIAMGDARLSLEKEAPERFDILAVDAFSGDAIPVHLLTKEAFVLYFRHLKPDGILAVHVSNRYLDLVPVVRQLAEATGKTARLVENDEDDAKEIAASQWVLVTSRRELLDTPELSDSYTPIEGKKGLRTWTDDYSNLFQILKKSDE
jgi:spermidine synthase